MNTLPPPLDLPVFLEPDRDGDEQTLVEALIDAARGILARRRESDQAMVHSGQDQAA